MDDSAVEGMGPPPGHGRVGEVGRPEPGGGEGEGGVPGPEGQRLPVVPCFRRQTEERGSAGRAGPLFGG